MKQPYQIIESWIDLCLTNSHKLTKWELDFCESLEQQLKLQGSISDRQEEILERIYSAKTD